MNSHLPGEQLTWLLVDAALSALALVVTVRWLADGVGPVSPGGDHFGGIRLVLLRVLEWGQFIVFVVLVGRFLVRPLAKRQDLRFDGLFILASFAMNIWDPLDNYFVFAFQYNANFWNIGSWGGFIPGWQSAEPELWAVPIAFIFGCYTWSWFAAVRIGSFIIARLRILRPTWPAWARYAIVYAAVAAQAAISEIVFMRLGNWTYPTTVQGFTLWSGQYAWPWFNPLIYGLTWTVMVWLRESSRADASGLSSVERGVVRISQSTWQRLGLRFLAIFGFISVTYIAIYFVPFNLIMMHGTLNTHLPSYFPTP